MSEWINVNDKLPQAYVYCLVSAIESKTGDVTTISIARHNTKDWEMLSNEPESNAVAMVDLTWFMYPCEITHWMPLPTPPDDDKM